MLSVINVKILRNAYFLVCENISVTDAPPGGDPDSGDEALASMLDRMVSNCFTDVLHHTCIGSTRDDPSTWKIMASSSNNLHSAI